jgi:serine protease AprX
MKHCCKKTIRKSNMQRVGLFTLCVIIVVGGTAATLSAQDSTVHYWVTLPSKNTSLKYTALGLGISDRAMMRRAKSLPSDQLIDEYDYPIDSGIVTQIKQTGVKVRTTSRWFNAVSVEATPRQVQTLLGIGDFKLNPVKKLLRQPLDTSDETQALSLLSKSSTSTSIQKTSSTVLDYGYSSKQLSNIKVTDLHALGVIGSGVVIGMIDNGFNNYRTHPALKNITVLATHDFIHNIDDVNRQLWETSGQGDHGEATLSIVGGYDSGSLIGAAYGASFILAKTEMDSIGDAYSEEDTYVAALEWMEQLGVNITSSSLAYKTFVDGTPNYTWQDLNGRTTKVAQAAVIAARKGVLVVTAMGNDGYLTSEKSSLHEDTTLWSPADADSILAVGSTASDFELAVDSGCGPTADGRAKPDVVAQGLGVYLATGTSSYGQKNGTSCATPLVAGAAACILSAHPSWSAQKVREAMLNTAVHYNDGTTQTATYPNNYYGYGVVNALDAVWYDLSDTVLATTPIVYKVYRNYPNPFNGRTTIQFDMPDIGTVDIDVYNILGQHIKTIFSGTVSRTTVTKYWDGTNAQGRSVASGVYIYHIKTDKFVSANKMLFLK